MLGSVGFIASYVLLGALRNYCRHRLETTKHELGVQPGDNIITYEVPEELEHYLPRKAGVFPFYTVPTSPITSTLTAKSSLKPTSPSASSLATASSSTDASTSTVNVLYTTSTTKGGPSIFTVTSVTSTETLHVVDSVTTALKSSTSLEVPTRKQPQASQRHSAAESLSVPRPQATVELPAVLTSPMPLFKTFDDFDWVAIYELGKEQAPPFNLTSKSEVANLERISAEALGLSRELTDIATAQLRHASRANALDEVLTLLAIQPLRDISIIIKELQGRFVHYNSNKTGRASDGMQMEPFIKDALERLDFTKPKIEELPLGAMQAYLAMVNTDKVDYKYCFRNSCGWCVRVAGRWQDVNRTRDFFVTRLSEVNERLLAADQEQWVLVLQTFQYLSYLLMLYTLLTVLTTVCTALPVRWFAARLDLTRRAQVTEAAEAAQGAFDVPPARPDEAPEAPVAAEAAQDIPPAGPAEPAGPAQAAQNVPPVREPGE